MQASACTSHFLGKWVETSLDINDGKGKLNQAIIDVDRIPGFSTNKIPESVPNDLNYVFNDDVKKVYNEDWVPGTEGVVPHAEHYRINNTRRHYFIPIKDIEGYTHTYSSVDKKSTHKLQLNVCHKPLISNYWHFEFTVKIDDNIIKNAGKSEMGYKKLACNFIATKVHEVALFSIPNK